MNAWTIYGIVMTALMALVILMDNRQIRKLNSMADASDGETRAWMRRYEEARMELRIVQERDAKMVSHRVLIRDEKIEQLERKIREMEASHAAELAMREKVIYSLEKGINEQRAQRGDRSK
jgi:hypothetical protein